MAGLKDLKTMTQEEAEAELELMAINKRQQRRKNVETGEAQRERIAEHQSTTLSDIAKSGAQTLSFEMGDEVIGGLTAGYKKITGDPRPISEIYTEASDAVKQGVANARSDTPFGTFLTDIVLPNPMKFAKYIKKLNLADRIGTAGKVIDKAGDFGQQMGPVQTGALYSAGYSEANPITEAGDFAFDVGMGAGVGALAKGVGAVGNKAFGDPQQTEIKYLGMEGTSHSSAEGDVLGMIDNLEDATEHLRKTGAFQKTAKDWSLKDRGFTVPFAKEGKAKVSIKQMMAPNTKQMIRKFKRATKKISADIEKKIRKSSPEIYQGEFSDDVKKLEGADAYLSGGTRKGYGSVGKEGIYGADDINQFDNNRVIEIQNNLAHDFEGVPSAIDSINRTVDSVMAQLTGGRNAFTVMDAQRVKQRIYKDLVSSYDKASKGAPPTFNDAEEATLKKMANLLKDFVNEKVPEVKLDNQDLEAMFAFKHSTNKKQALKYFGGDPAVRANSQMGFFTSFGSEVYDPLRPYTAKIGRMYQGAKAKGVPYARPYLEGVGSSFGGKAMGRIMGTEAQEMEERLQPDRFGRSPDSIGRAMDEAAEELMNTPLPRDAEQILANPQAMLMKVAQMNPDAYDQVNHLLTKRPDLLRASFPMLVNAMPQLFELDDYNRIDGKIRDPQLRIKAEQDLWKRDDIPVEHKVEINDMLNKDGSYPL